MKCKHERAPANATFCPDCGARLIELRGETKVPPPKLRGNKWGNKIAVGEERVYISAQTEEEYYAKAKAAKLGLIETQKALPRMTLGKAIDDYIQNNDAVLSPSTINAYKSYRRTRFEAYMGADISKLNYQRMVNEEARKVSPKTVHNAWRLVTAALADEGIPAPEVNLPQKVKPNRPWLDYAQIERFCEVIKGKPYEAAALLALNGCRRSEILHLTADDVDTDKGVIYIRGASVVGDGNKLVDKATNKTASSTRTVHIVIPRLNELLKDAEGRLLQTNPTTLYGLINKLCKKNGLPEVGVHGLRHSFASLAYHLNWSEATTMREGGWSDTGTVHRIYTHLAAQDADSDVERMKNFYGNTGL